MAMAECVKSSRGRVKNGPYPLGPGKEAGWLLCNRLGSAFQAIPNDNETSAIQPTFARVR